MCVCFRDTTFSGGVVGKAIKGTICTFQYSGGVNLVSKARVSLDNVHWFHICNILRFYRNRCVRLSCLSVQMPCKLISLILMKLYTAVV